MKVFSLFVTVSAFAARLISAKSIALNDTNFDEIAHVGSLNTTQEKPWFIKFYAPWCGHCKRLAPEWSKFAESISDQVNVGEVDATLNNAIADRFDIKGYPTLLYFHDGQMTRYRGSRKASDLVKFVSSGYAESEAKAVPTGPSKPKKLRTSLSKKEKSSHWWNF